MASMSRRAVTVPQLVLLAVFTLLLAPRPAWASNFCGGFQDPPCEDGSCVFVPEDGSRTVVNDAGVCVPCGNNGRAACAGARLLVPDSADSYALTGSDILMCSPRSVITSILCTWSPRPPFDFCCTNFWQHMHLCS